MESNKNIPKHIDELMAQAEQGDRIQSSPDFLQKLNQRIDEQNAPAGRSPVYSFKEILKYAAIIVITLLNLSALFLVSQTTETDVNSTATSDEIITEFADQYFPEYTLSELEAEQ